jgi:hypothetical protein
MIGMAYNEPNIYYLLLMAEFQSFKTFCCCCFSFLMPAEHRFGDWSKIPTLFPKILSYFLLNSIPTAGIETIITVIDLSGIWYLASDVGIGISSVQQ